MAAKPFTTQPNAEKSPTEHKSSPAEVSAGKSGPGDDSHREGEDEGKGEAPGSASGVTSFPSDSHTRARQEQNPEPAKPEPEKADPAKMSRPGDRQPGKKQPEPDHYTIEKADNRPSPDDAAMVVLDFLPVENRRQFMDFCRQHNKTPIETIVMSVAKVTDHRTELNEVIRQEGVTERMYARPPQAGGFECPQCGRMFKGGTTYCSAECGAAARKESLA